MNFQTRNSDAKSYHPSNTLYRANFDLLDFESAMKLVVAECEHEKAIFPPEEPGADQFSTGLDAYADAARKCLAEWDRTDETDVQALAERWAKSDDDYVSLIGKAVIGRDWASLAI